jgi:predicted porin
MKKSLLALAAMGAFAGAAQAQSSVSVYGIMDIGLTNLTSDNGTTTTTTRTTAKTGAYSTSRLGFRGTEDLGKGLSANFNFEIGLNPIGNRLRAPGTTTADTANLIDYKNDQTAGDLVVRTQNVGLAGGFGSLTIGRMATLADDVFGLGDVGGGNNFRGRTYSHAPSATQVGDTNLINARSDRLVRYVSPTFNGISIGVAYGTASAPTAAAAATDNSGTEMGAMIRYSAGPAAVGVGYQSHKDVVASVDRRESTALVVAGNYNFKVAQAFFNYQTGEIKNDYAAATTLTQTLPIQNAAFGAAGVSNKRSISEIGVAVPTGAWRFAASYYMGARDAKANEAAATIKTNLTGYQAAALYNLSKRTNLYAVYGSAKSAIDNSSTTTVNDYGVGVRHTF